MPLRSNPVSEVIGAAEEDDVVAVGAEDRLPGGAVAAAALFLTFLLGTPALSVLWLRARANSNRAEVEQPRRAVPRPSHGTCTS